MAVAAAVAAAKHTHKRKTSNGNSCFSCFMPAIVDDKEPTSTGVRLDQNAYNNMSKFGNMSKPKKNDAHESTSAVPAQHCSAEQDANGARGGNASPDASEKPTEDPTSELAEAALVVEESAASSVRSEPPPNEDGAPSAVQDSETRKFAGNMELNQQQQYTAVTTKSAEPVEERILSSNPVSSNSGKHEYKAVTTPAEPVQECILCSTSAVPAQHYSAEQHWQELQGDFKFVRRVFDKPDAWKLR